MTMARYYKENFKEEEVDFHDLTSEEFSKIVAKRKEESENELERILQLSGIENGTNFISSAKELRDCIQHVQKSYIDYDIHAAAFFKHVGTSHALL